jgi:hypothetical protein
MSECPPNRLVRSQSLPALVLKYDPNVLVCKYCKNSYLATESKCPCRDDSYPIPTPPVKEEKSPKHCKLKNVGKSKSVHFV